MNQSRVIERMEDEEVIIINSTEEEFPSPIQIIPEIQDATDYVGFDDYKKEFGLEDMPETPESDDYKREFGLEDMPETPESAAVTGRETNHDVGWDWGLLEEDDTCTKFSDRHDELIIKDEDDDIYDINLAVCNEDRVTESEALGEETNIDESREELTLENFDTPGVKKEQYALGEDAASSFRIISVHTFEAGRISQTVPKKKKLLFKCDQCDFSTGIRFALARHQLQHSSRPTKSSRKTDPGSTSSSTGTKNLQRKSVKLLRKCPTSGCTFRNFSRMAFDRHVLSHNSMEKMKKIVKCSHCPAALTRAGLLVHMSIIHKDQMEKCVKCHKNSVKGYKHRCLGDKPVLKLKSKVSSSNENAGLLLKCQFCSFNSKYPTVLKRHQFNYHQNDKAIKALQCRHCSFAAFNTVSLMVHMIKIHIEHCNKCEFCFKLVPSGMKREHLARCVVRISQKKRMMKREAKVKEQQQVGKMSNQANERKKIKCSMCSYVPHEKDKARYKKHLKRHSNNERIVKCKKCDFTSFQSIVNHHIIFKHRRTDDNKVVINQQLKKKCAKKTDSYKCKKCSYRGSSEVTFRYHMKLHEKNYPIKQCPQCDYRSTEVALKFHLKKAHATRCTKANPKQIREDALAQCPSDVSHSTGLDKENTRVQTIQKALVVKCHKNDSKSSASLDQKNISFGQHPSKTTGASEPHNHASTSLDDSSSHVVLKKLKVKLASVDLTSLDDEYDKLHDFVERVRFKSEDSYRCRICSTSVKYKYQMQTHLQTHTELTRSVSLPKGLPLKDHHKLTVSSNIVFICEHCDFATQFKYALLSHKKKHSASRSTILPSATKTESDKSVPLLKDEHHYPIQVGTHLPCKIISSSTGNIRHAEKPREGFSSNTSTDFKNNLTPLSDHKLIEDYTARMNGEWMQYCCNQCVYKTFHKEVIYMHVKNHEIHHEVPLKCPFCSDRTSSKRQLQRHIFTKHSLDEEIEEQPISM